MSAPIPIKFKLTDAGRLATLDAFNSGLSLKLTHVAIGLGKYNSETTGAGQTALQNEIARYPISGGSIEPVSRTLRFSAILESGVTQNAFEVGLFDENGVLFAVASTTSNDPLILVTANIAFVASLSLLLADINVSNLSVVDDPSSPLAIALMNQHLANPDPHPQYPLKSVLASIIYPVGSWHGTNNASYNPATALVPLFGYQTTWYLWPYVPAGVANTNAALGQIVEFAAGAGTQAMTTRIWERLADGASTPTYTLTASQNTVDEGQQVTFTLTTTGLAQGTAVAWNMTGIQSADISPNALTGQFVVGADGSASHAVTIIADEATEGTETLKFALTYISNKFVNVVINDSSVQAEQIVNITSDQTDLNLLNLFTGQYGAPTTATKAVFVVNDGVNIIASATLASAVTGDHWPAGSTREIRVMNGAMLAGRGGGGGQATYVNDSVAARSGENGGTAIMAESDSPIVISNYGLIAGGGGGGGASGTPYMIFQDKNAAPLVMPGAGGAPFGASGVFSRGMSDASFDFVRVTYQTATPVYGWVYTNIDNWQKIEFASFASTEGTAYVFADAPKPWPDATFSASYNPPESYAVPDGYGSSNIIIKGGIGGQIGESGSAGLTTTGIDNQQGNSFSTLVEPGIGGMAGYIYQGPVTINNIDAGQTRGRTP